MTSLPPLSIYPAAPLAIGASWSLALFATSRSWWSLVAVQGAFWLGAYAFGLWWMTELTVPGWIAAVPVEAAIMTAATAIALRTSTPAREGSRVGVFVGAAALVVGEFVRAEVPFGGVPMSNLALGSVEAPWFGVARVLGALGLVAIVGAYAAGVTALIDGLRSRRLAAIVPAAAVPVAVTVFVALAAAAPNGAVAADAARDIDVALVQTGGKLGTQGATAATFDNHVAQLERHAATLSDVDLILWSESSASSDGSLDESPHLQRLFALSERYQSHIVANFYERVDDENGKRRFYNASVVVAPNGTFDRHDKVHLVPFGEYVPLRWLVEPFADLSLIPREAIAGSGPGVLDSAFGPLAVATSFEIYFPYVVDAAVRAGGQIIVNPTLASSYRTERVAAQSLASARIRAVETGRWVLQASTTGYTAVVTPDGDVVERSELGEPAVLRATVGLRTGTTSVLRLGSWAFGWACVMVMLAAAFGSAADAQSSTSRRLV